MFLEKDGVNLYYEVRGQGEPLLLIHGVIVDAWLYERAGEILAKRFQVITYDRRGSSRSKAQEGVSYDMDGQIGDVKNLLDELRIERAYIVGASAGAVIGQYFMQCYPQRVKKLIMYEPPLIAMIKDNEKYWNWILKMEDMIRRRKFSNATLEFAKSIGPTDERAPQKPREVSDREMENIFHFLRHEYSVFMRYYPDLEQSRRMAEDIIVAVGEKSGALPYPTAARNFAKLIGAKLLHYPGYHNLPADLPEEFAMCVMGTLALCE